MKKLKRNRFTDVNQLVKFTPRLLADFLAKFGDLGFAIPKEPTERSMPYDAIRRAGFRYEEVPPEFLVATHLVSTTATPSQRYRVEELASRRGIELNIPGDTSDHDFALLVWAAHPDLVEMAYGYAIMVRQRKYAYYPHHCLSPSEPAAPTSAALRAAEKDLDDLFKRKGYGIGARIMVEETCEELWFLIRRGERLARVAAVDDDGESVVHVLRPEHYDVVVLNKHYGFLKVLAKPDNQGLHGPYRHLFGTMLYGNPAAFVERPCFRVTPVAHGEQTLLTDTTRPAETSHVAFVGVCFELPGAHKRNCRYKSPDVLGDIGSGIFLMPDNAITKDITLLVSLPDGPDVEVKVFSGNLATFTRDGSAADIDELLLKASILMLEAPFDAKAA